MAKHILTANVRRLVTIYETLSLSAVPRSTPIREGMMSLVRRDFLLATGRNRGRARCGAMERRFG
jgi:hypothetical protein